MTRKLCGWKIALGLSLAAGAWGGTFGKVVAIGGHASDIALDEARGVLYVANFTANRIEVMSLADGSIRTSINVAPQPGSLALSRDGRYLVVAHFGNFQAPNTPRNALTVVDLDGGGRETFALGAPPLGVAIGIDNRALVVTNEQFLLFDPVLGTTQVLGDLADVAARTLPAKPGTFPSQIVASSLGVSSDAKVIYGLLASGTQDTESIEFSYQVIPRMLRAVRIVANPPLGPRVVSVNQDGSYYLSGWAMNDARGNTVAQFPNAAGVYQTGGHVMDPRRGLIYAQLTQAAQQSTGTAQTGTTTTQTTAAQSGPPVLELLEIDNLAVRERLRLPENLAGKALLSGDGQMVYAISDSGLLMLPVGSLDRARRVVADREDLVFRASPCDRRTLTQEIAIVDPGGGNTDFVLSSDTYGVQVEPEAGVTPAVVRVKVDPSVFQNQKGTVTVKLKIDSGLAVNVPPSVRVLVNLREPDQRGTVVNVPGKLVDLLADPVRDRFYILRQDTNQVLVFDGTSYAQLATLRTGNTPTQMAVSYDRRYLLVGNDNSQIANVFDLDTLQPSQPIIMPGGHYPRSIAASGRTILVANRVAGPKHKIDKVDWASRTAVEYPTLGVYENDIHLNTVLIPSPNGGSIMAASADGNLMLYNSNVDSFTVWRKDSTAAGGAYAASGFDQFVVGNSLLNASLVKVRDIAIGTEKSSGFAFVDQGGYLVSTGSSSDPGTIRKVDLSTGEGQRATRTSEAALVGTTDFAFTRTLAPLYSRKAIILLTISGFTVLSWDYDASVAPPRIDRVVNAADQTTPVAPGGLISIYGQGLSPVNLATREMPLPTALGETCLTVNGLGLPMLMVSSSQINAQLPFQLEGNVTMLLRTPSGVSDNYNFTVLPAAPSVFRTAAAGPEQNLPAVYRDKNGEPVTGSNPIHRNESIVVYLTGMGKTSPSVDAGVLSPSDPLPAVLIPPQVTLGGVPLTVGYAGLTPGQLGVYQINAYVPWGAPLGLSVPLSITQGSITTTLNVRVVE